jgi:hypothetical protein
LLAMLELLRMLRLLVMLAMWNPIHFHREQSST